MTNILLTVVSLNFGNDHSQKRFNSKLENFKRHLRQYDTAGMKAAIKLIARTKEEKDVISIQVDSDNELLRNRIYGHAALFNS